jgi:DNA topoisomerase-2
MIEIYPNIAIYICYRCIAFSPMLPHRNDTPYLLLMTKKIMSEYQNLDPLEHLLRYPERDLGDTTFHIAHKHMVDMNTMRLYGEEIAFNDAIERLFLEIAYNAADNVERSRQCGIDPGSIYIDMSNQLIRVKNEGRPISCNMQPGTDLYIPEFIFGKLMTSSNYDAS